MLLLLLATCTLPLLSPIIACILPNVVIVYSYSRFSSSTHSHQLMALTTVSASLFLFSHLHPQSLHRLDHHSSPTAQQLQDGVISNDVSVFFRSSLITPLSSFPPLSSSNLLPTSPAISTTASDSHYSFDTELERINTITGKLVSGCVKRGEGVDLMGGFCIHSASTTQRGGVCDMAKDEDSSGRRTKRAQRWAGRHRDRQGRKTCMYEM